MSSADLLSSRACEDHRKKHARCPINCPGRLSHLKELQKRLRKAKEEGVIAMGPNGLPLSISPRRRGRKRKVPLPDQQVSKAVMSPPSLDSTIEVEDSSMTEETQKIPFSKRKKTSHISQSSATDRISDANASDDRETETQNIRSKPKDEQKENEEMNSSSSPSSSSSIHIIELDHSARFSLIQQELIQQQESIPVTYLKGQEEEILNELSNSDEDPVEDRRPSELDEIDSLTDVSQFLVDEYQSEPTNNLTDSPNPSPKITKPRSLLLSFSGNPEDMIQQCKHAITLKQVLLNQYVTEKEELAQRRKLLLQHLQQTEKDIRCLDDMIIRQSHEKTGLEKTLNGLQANCNLAASASYTQVALHDDDKSI